MEMNKETVGAIRHEGELIAEVRCLQDENDYFRELLKTVVGNLTARNKEDIE